MALQNFIARSLPTIKAAWLNQVDALKFTIFGDSTTKAAARAALTSDASFAVSTAMTGGAQLTQLNYNQYLGNSDPYKRTAAEISAGVTPSNMTFDRQYIERQGAVGDLATASLTSINNAILVNNRHIRSYDGDFLVSTTLTNPLGKQFLGTGAILKVDPLGGYQQLNTYANFEGRYVFGKEYLYRIYKRLEVEASVGIKTFAFGDSTIATGGSSESVPFRLENLLPEMCRTKGLNQPLILTNRGVSGTDWSDLSALTDLAVDTDLYIIKYGINDGLVGGDRLTEIATQMRSKLAAIRAATFGSEELLSIVLVGPNSTNDSPQGRDERWYEQLRNVYIRAARDYKCCYIDIYGMFQDSRSAAGLWGDNPFANGIMIHPNDIGRSWIWGAVIDAIFGDCEIDQYRSNKFSNNSGTYFAPLLADEPTTYPMGWSGWRALTADGWPEDGIVITFRHIDGPAIQWLYPFAAGRTIIVTRVSNLSGNAWNLWAGEVNALTLQNSWITFGGGFDTPKAVLDNSGIVTVTMVISGGTVTANTVLSTLPAGLRPSATVGPFLCYTSGAPSSVRIESSGNIIVHTVADVTGTAINCSFRAV